MAVLPRPFYHWTTYSGHGGIDFPRPRGTAVLASGPGVIDFSGYYSPRGGYAKFITYDCGCRHGYYHFDREAGLGRGARVDYGTPFAYVGSLGQNSTGPHLHHEVWRGHSSIIKPPGYWNYVSKTAYVGDGSVSGTEGKDMPLNEGDKKVIKDAIFEFLRDTGQINGDTGWKFIREAVWGHPIEAQDLTGHGIGAKFSAEGFLASINAHASTPISAAQIKVIADATANQVAASLKLPTPQIDYAAVAKAVNDDAAARMVR